MPVEAHLTLSCRCMNVIFIGTKGHFVMNKYLYLLNMESVYHIVTIRVNEPSWAHVWGLHSLYLGTGYDRLVELGLVSLVGWVDPPH
jgi:hypothetical protein